MKMLVYIILGLFSFLLILIAWSSFPWSLSEKSEDVEIVNIEPEEMFDEEDNPSVVKILSWNLGFLYGQGSEGPGYEFRNKEYFLARLEQLVQEIQTWDPDIICLQEVDFDSSRSHGINQAQYLARKAGYPYVAEAVSWKANYIPFPYWPMINNFGRVNSGGAILSRYPILDQNVTLLSKPQSQPWWYNLFYLHRYFQKATIEVGEKKLKIVNLHLEAFDKIDRSGQVERLVEKVSKESLDLIVGDFNMLPTVATKKSKFFNDDDYENDSSFEIMKKASLSEVVPENIYSKSESTYFTFPSWKPDRRLDYIFYRQDLKMMKAEVLSSALSDHLPIRATIQISDPKFNPYSQ